MFMVKAITFGTSNTNSASEHPSSDKREGKRGRQIASSTQTGQNQTRTWDFVPQWFTPKEKIVPPIQIEQQVPSVRSEEPQQPHAEELQQFHQQRIERLKAFEQQISRQLRQK